MSLCLPVRHPPRDTAATLPVRRSGDTAGVQRRSESFLPQLWEVYRFTLYGTWSGRCGCQDGSDSGVPLGVQRAHWSSQVRRNRQIMRPVAVGLLLQLSF